MAREKANSGSAGDAQQESPPVPVVGIGASAGGLGALETLLPTIAPDSGLAYVIVQHLDPDHESVLAALLERLATVPVAVIQHQTPVKANHIYVIPPNASLAIADDSLLLSPPIAERAMRTPIDGFFISLAESRGEAAAGVILSGSGSDGTLGLRAIREHGGLTIAQAGAEYDGMMRSAVRSGVVDFVLPLTEIAPKVAQYFQHHVDGGGGLVVAEGDVAQHLGQIALLLRTRTGHDFSGYKDKTVGRRVQRRMQVLQIDRVPDFIDRLRNEPKEVDLLLQDLLIGVTSFFRDPEAFAALETKVIPQLFADKGSDDVVRVWVPGCSTGEEAYSIAILLREHMPKGHGTPKVQIFATDIDEHALAVARLGRYPATIAKDVPKKRLERYFMREDGTYRIAADLRELCLFAFHNLLRDAPFSKLDLISCRNLLIYLTPELQNRLIPLFHYALTERGHLFLGNSENVSRHTRLFSVVDKSNRIFASRSRPERFLPEFPLTAPHTARRGAPTVRPQVDQPSLQALAERQLLESYAPAFVVIDAEGGVLHGSSRTGKYLELAPGAPRIDVFSMARHGLRPDLRAGVRKAAESGQVTVQKNLVIGTNGGRQTIDLVIHPLRPSQGHGQDQLFMVVFQDVGGIAAVEEPAGAGEEDRESSNLRQLELELRATRERLQSTTEELESANEELKSGNEELSSINEELQSSNEELETSKEELQSINEELQTVNAELNAKVEELARANSDMANLLESTQIATLFLDRHLQVKTFTPAAKDLFRLVESDAGRPIGHVRARFKSDTVEEDAERVLRTLAAVERQVESADTGARYIMRTVPYRTTDNVISGVVMTFVDVSRITAAEERIEELTSDLRQRIENLEALLDLVPVGILIARDGEDQALVNRYGAGLLGEAIETKESDGLRPLVRPLRLFDGERELKAEELPMNAASRTARTLPNFEGQLLRADGTRLDVLVSSAPLVDEAGKVRGGIAAVVDLSERKAAEARQQVLLFELQHRVKNIIATVSALATRTMRTNQPAEKFAEAFLGRLRGMAGTHELLSRTNWQGTLLADLIDAALRAHAAADRASVDIEGPAVLMTPNAAATLGMVFYELATNAAKYGALSLPGGRVEVAWTTEGTPASRVIVSWRETGGKRFDPAAGPGFGTTFVKRSIEYELQGSAEVEKGTGGLCWTLQFPFQQNVQRP